jgi:hypothetical protein
MSHQQIVSHPRTSVVFIHPDHPPGAATRYIGEMKTASLPAVPVEPALREELEAALEEGESMDEFIEGAVRERVRRRKEARAAFIARAMASLEEAERTGVYYSLEEVERMLRRKVEEAKKRHAAKHGSPG